MSDPWIDIHVHSEWGESLQGQPVYKNTFNPKFHIANSVLRPIRGYPLIIGCDFARWPAAIICQMDNRGRLLVLQELERENCGVEKFATEDLLPMLYSERFAGMSAYICGDPSGVSKSQIGEESVFAMLKRHGFVAYPASTNFIDPRLRAVEKWLVQQRDGGAALLVDPENCPKLIRGFKSTYRFKLRKNGVMEDTPDKTNRPFPDLHDALQYACLGTAENIRGAVMRSRTPRAKKPTISAAAWT